MQAFSCHSCLCLSSFVLFLTAVAILVHLEVRALRQGLFYHGCVNFSYLFRKKTPITSPGKKPDQVTLTDEQVHVIGKKHL